MYQGQGSSEVKLGGKCKIVFFFEKLKFDYNQAWVKDATGFLNMLMRSKVICRARENRQFEKVKRRS